MTDMDYSKIKAGDTIGLMVDYVAATGDVLVKDGFGNTPIKPHAIVSHTPAPKPALKVGDRVRHPDSFHPAREIIWIEDGWVYFRPVFSGERLAPTEVLRVETWERLS